MSRQEAYDRVWVHYQLSQIAELKRAIQDYVVASGLSAEENRLLRLSRNVFLGDDHTDEIDDLLRDGGARVNEAIRLLIVFSNAGVNDRGHFEWEMETIDDALDVFTGLRVRMEREATIAVSMLQGALPQLEEPDEPTSADIPQERVERWVDDD